MKKMLFIAVAAIALMACTSENGAEIKPGDKKALNAATSISQLGATPDNYDKAMTAAGYRKVDGSFMLGVRARVKAFDAPKSSEELSVEYIYGFSADDLKLSEDKLRAKFNEIIESGNSIIALVAVFNEGQLSYAETALMMTPGKGIKKSHVEQSKNMIDQIPANAFQAGWYAMIEADTVRLQYEDIKQYSDYAAAVVATEGAMMAHENVQVIKTMDQATGKMEGFYYNATLAVPGDEDSQRQKEQGLAPTAAGMYTIADIAQF